jgi:RNA polymerase sigma factor for flagellar operon FliA
MTDPSIAALWATYADNRRDQATRNALIERYLPLVNRVAMNMKSEMPRHVELDDLISYGSFGLIDAVERFEPKRGARFSSFAWPRIKGAIWDQIRLADDVRRNVREVDRAIANARHELTTRHQRTPTHDEVAEEMGVSREEYDRQRATVAVAVTHRGDGHDLPSLAEVIYTNEPTPHDAYDVTELREKMVAAWNALPPRERTVLSLRYVEGLTYAEAADALGGIASSRVNQVVTDGIRALRLEISVL